MKALLLLLAGFMMLALSLTPAWAQVETCTQKMPAIRDGRLQAAVDALRAKFPDLVFQAKDAEDPCRRAKVTTSALAATLRRNYLTPLAGFEYVKVIDGEGYFTIERFQMPNDAARKRLVEALEKCQHCKLEIPENTCMAHFVADDSVVLMISAAAVCKASREKFQLIEQAFLTQTAPSKELGPRVLCDNR
jgi:ATP/maltotriose-dependent transcriptional regulator MalT